MLHLELGQDWVAEPHRRKAQRTIERCTRPHSNGSSDLFATWTHTISSIQRSLLMDVVWTWFGLDT